MGQRQKRLLILEALPPSADNRPGKGGPWRCLCDCGREVVIPNENIKYRASCGKCPKPKPVESHPFRRRVFAARKKGVKRRTCSLCSAVLPVNRHFTCEPCFNSYYGELDVDMAEGMI